MARAVLMPIQNSLYASKPVLLSAYIRCHEFRQQVKMLCLQGSISFRSGATAHIQNVTPWNRSIMPGYEKVRQACQGLVPDCLWKDGRQTALTDSPPGTWA